LSKSYDPAAERAEMSFKDGMSYSDYPHLHEAIPLVAGNGFDVGADAERTDWRETRAESEAVLAAWRAVYRDPGHYWMLYELAEKLVDFEDYFRRWRFNHVTTVERIIGMKRGTGGTSGPPISRRCWRLNCFRNSGKFAPCFEDSTTTKTPGGGTR
jgi:tryptophan 2,3-dioxygenase